MAKFSLRRFENQALVSVIVSAISFLPLAAMTIFILKRMDWAEKTLYYGPRSKVGILACGLFALMSSTIGFGFGLNSAGQRRNDKQQMSWIGFFLGALVLVLTFVVFAIFRLRGEELIK